MSILDGSMQIANEKTCKAPWLGGKNGKYFRCAFCGHKFQSGDQWRCQFTNDVAGAGGNPLVCKSCDAPKEELVARWKAMWEQWNEIHRTNGQWWWFARHCNG